MTLDPILTAVPSRVIAGTTVQWTYQDAVVSPADGWGATFTAIGASGKITIVASDYGNGTFLFLATMAASASWVAGAYRYQIVVAKDAESYLSETGRWEVEPGFSAQAGAYDARTTWEKILEDLNTAYAEFVATNGARTSFSVAGRATTYSTAEEFIKAIHNAEVQVNKAVSRERVQQGLPSGRKLGTRMP